MGPLIFGSSHIWPYWDCRVSLGQGPPDLVFLCASFGRAAGLSGSALSYGPLIRNPCTPIAMPLSTTLKNRPVVQSPSKMLRAHTRDPHRTSLRPLEVTVPTMGPSWTLGDLVSRLSNEPHGASSGLLWGLIGDTKWTY